MTPSTVGLNEDGPLRRPLPGRLESHDADPGLDRRDRPREVRWDRTRRLCGPRPTCSIVDREAGLHGAWRSVQVAVAAAVVVDPLGYAASGVHHDLLMAAGRGHRHEPARA